MEKIFLNSYCSILESDILNAELSDSLRKSNYVVNPHYSYLMNKAIIVDLPIEINFDKLSTYCDIYSRFPIDGIQLVPYVEPANQDKKKVESYSKKILNKYMMDSDEPEQIKEVMDTDYLIGIETDIDGYLTAVGYKLMQSNLNEFVESDDVNNSQ